MVRKSQEHPGSTDELLVDDGAIREFLNGEHPQEQFKTACLTARFLLSEAADMMDANDGLFTAAEYSLVAAWNCIDSAIETETLEQKH